MELKLKKRIVGIALLLAMGFIIIPMFFGRSVNTDELKLSAHIPNPPPLPAALNAPMPAREATLPAIAKESNAVGGIVFEQLESIPPKMEAAPAVTTAEAINPLESTPASLPSAAPVVEDHSVPAAPLNPAVPASVAPATTSVSAAALVNETPAKIQAQTKKIKQKPLPLVATKNTKTTNTAANPESWAVQLGSFSDKMNAANLMKKLQDAGFSAYMHDSKTMQGNLIRVLVGPQLHRSDADKIQKQLQQQFSLKSIIVKVSS